MDVLGGFRLVAANEWAQLGGCYGGFTSGSNSTDDPGGARSMGIECHKDGKVQGRDDTGRSEASVELSRVREETATLNRRREDPCNVSSRVSGIVLYVHDGSRHSSGLRCKTRMWSHWQLERTINLCTELAPQAHSDVLFLGMCLSASSQHTNLLCD